MGKDEYTPKARTLQVRIDESQDSFLISLVREYRKTNPKMTKSQAVRNIITAFEALMTTPLVDLLMVLPQESPSEKDGEEKEE